MTMLPALLRLCPKSLRYECRRSLLILDLPLETERLWLKSLDAVAAEGPYACWLADSEVMRFIEIDNAQSDVVSIAAYIDLMNRSPDNYLFGIFTQANGRHIGNIKLGSIHQHYQRADIGLLIGDRASWGQGYASEAIAAISEFAGYALHLRRVFASCHETNLGSVKAFRKSGFEIEGRLRQHARDGDEFVDCLILGRLLKAE